VSAHLDTPVAARRGTNPASDPVAPIAVSSGEPAGVGPEICLALAASELAPRVVVLGDRGMLEARARQLRISVKLRDYGSQPEAGSLACLHLPLAYDCRAGALDRRNAPYVVALLDRAIAGCGTGEFAALVTAPVHKGVINDGGIPFIGHTEYLAERTGAPHVVMMLAGGGLRVALATTHLGEGGYFGREEIDVISPVLDKLRSEGMQLRGPLPADTLFVPERLAGADCALAMYHDQGLPVLKYASFGKGVNITLGLPMIRTSVDHGTAIDIAGTGRAQAESLIEAVETAITMARIGAR
jgi:4-hydroxythreonine-4-phosphate dehydrogenase